MPTGKTFASVGLSSGLFSKFGEGKIEVAELPGLGSSLGGTSSAEFRCLHLRDRTLTAHVANVVQPWSLSDRMIKKKAQESLLTDSLKILL